MVTDVSYDILMKDCGRLILLTSECQDVIKKDVEDHRGKVYLCKS